MRGDDCAGGNDNPRLYQDRDRRHAPAAACDGGEFLDALGKLRHERMRDSGLGLGRWLKTPPTVGASVGIFLAKSGSSGRIPMSG